MSLIKKVPTLYNPGEKTKESLIAEFTVRQVEFRTIFEELRSTNWKYPGQHFLILGQRGMGKTTLMYRLRYALEDEAELREHVFPVSFSEEHYGIGDLGNLWEYIAEYLDVNYEGVFDEMYDEMVTHLGEPDYEGICFKILKKGLRKAKKQVVLLIDNFGELIDKFKKEEVHRLREILMTYPRIRLIAANPGVFEQQLDYGQPFFEFFYEIRLKGLTEEETYALLGKLGEVYGRKEEVDAFLKHGRHRIEPLRRLSGGVIRTILLLFEIFLDNDTGRTFNDLQLILDRVTPLYKARMDDLKPQQQRIMDAVARAWDAVSAGQLANLVRMPSNKVSAQLKQLIANQLMEKVETGTKNHLYRMRERFFNIWYLMRHAKRKDKERVKWLVNFFDVWLDEESLANRVESHVGALESGTFEPEAAYFMTLALMDSRHITAIQRQELLSQTKAYLKDLMPKKAAILEKELAENSIGVLWEVILNEKTDVWREILSQLEVGIDKEFSFDKFSVILNAGYQVVFSGQKKEDQHEKATAFINQNMDRNPTFSHFLLGFLANAKGDLENALLHYGHVPGEQNVIGLVGTGLKFVKKKEHKKAEEVFELVKGDNAVLMGSPKLLNYFRWNKYPKKALEIAREMDAQKRFIGLNDTLKVMGAGIFLWNNEFESGRKLLGLIEENSDGFKGENVDPTSAFNDTLLLFLAKEQYHMLKSLFDTQPILKDKAKPIYYALMHHLREEYPLEILKMGPELEETVQEILEKVKQMAIDYA